MAIDRERLQAELRRMRELIASDPRVLARFDTDGNGVIDGDEWEAVRQLVTRRLEREEVEAELARRLADEQAAEMARLQADIEAERAAAEEPAPAPGVRDYANLELAFDPRADAAVRQQRVAEEIYEKELYRRYADPAPHRSGTLGTLGDRRELILEQGGGAKQLFGNLFRRHYVVRDRDGHELGHVGQRENEALQNLVDYSIFTDPSLHFRVHDYASDTEYEFRRTTGLGENYINVNDPRGRTIAMTSWTVSFLRRKYEVRVVREGVSYYVRRRALRPWTFEILDPFDEPIGEMQRGWSGLGFLTGGNLFHLELDVEVSADAMWGFLATALLADLDSESGSRRAGLDLFNS